MFITLTINTTSNKKSPIKIHKQKINAATGWRKAIFMKKRSVWQKFKDWRKTVKAGKYLLDGQTAMF